MMRWCVCVCVALAAALPALGQFGGLKGLYVPTGDISPDFLGQPASLLDRLDETGTSVSFVDARFSFLQSFGLDRNNDRVIMALNETGPSFGGIYAVDFDLDSSSVTPLQVFTSGRDVRALTIDPGTDDVYWYEFEGMTTSDPGGTLYRGGVANGSVITPIVSGLPFLSEPRIDVERAIVFGTINNGSEVYWASFDGSGDADSFFLNGADARVISIEPLSGDLVWTEFDISTVDARVVRLNRQTGALQTLVSRNTTSIIVAAEAFGGFVVFTDYDVATDDIQMVVLDTATQVPQNFGPITADFVFDFQSDIDLGATIIGQPGDQTLQEGAFAVLSVTSAAPGSAFRWQKNGVPMTDDDRVFGTSTSQLRLEPAQASDSDFYRCVVQGTDGRFSISREALLLVRSEPVVDDCPADVNGDGEATPADFTAWLQFFNEGPCP